MNIEPGTIIVDSDIGKGTIIRKYCNIYRSIIGQQCKIASFVEIGGATIGNHCKIEAYVFIPPGIKIGDHVFIGPHVTFTNDRFPVAQPTEWTVNITTIDDGVSIGANSTIMSGIKIGKNAKVGAGSVVTKDVAPDTIVYGDGAKERGTIH